MLKNITTTFRISDLSKNGFITSDWAQILRPGVSRPVDSENGVSCSGAPAALEPQPLWRAALERQLSRVSTVVVVNIS